eukprot:NP_001229625.1 uncharacterized protein LOC283403 [Homo sapiens]
MDWANVPPLLESGDLGGKGRTGWLEEPPPCKGPGGRLRRRQAQSSNMHLPQLQGRSGACQFTPPHDLMAVCARHWLREQHLTEKILGWATGQNWAKTLERGTWLKATPHFHVIFQWHQLSWTDVLTELHMPQSSLVARVSSVH